MGRAMKSPDFRVHRPGHDRRYAMDFAKATRELGWRPLADFPLELARTVAWYDENREWWA